MAKNGILFALNKANKTFLMKAILISLLSLLFISTQAQVKTNSTQSADYYVRNILKGQGIELDHVKFIGKKGSIAQFNANENLLGVKSGIIMSTGNADSVGTPNTSNRYTSQAIKPDDKALVRQIKRGDKDLNKLCKGQTHDISVIEFDFVPIKNKIEFNFVFASDEYPEFAGSVYNDVFGFFLSGPDIIDKINLAVLPDGKTPVTINNVNQNKNPQYFRQNRYPMNFIHLLFMGKQKRRSIREVEKQIQFDGMTTVLKAEHDVIPFKKYHIKLAIADVADEDYDSAVFLEAGSFTSVIDTNGKYYSMAKQLENFHPNMDSILNPKENMLTQNEKKELKEEEPGTTEVYFAYNSYSVPDSCKHNLDALANYLANNTNLICSVIGYADNSGSLKYNEKLSRNRAIEVEHYLMQKGVKEEQLHCRGLSSKELKSKSFLQEQQQFNRRVEIMIE